MTLEHTLSDLTQRLEEWQTRGINEAQTAQAIVLRILQVLGYDIWNPFEVLPEASGNGLYRPDYTIQLDRDVRFIIEVKLLGKNLADTEKDMTQAVNYINSLGKRWAILTNGQEWLFLDNDIRGETSQKRALTIDLTRHAKDAAGYLERLLGKAHWQKHDAEDALEPIIKDIREDIQKRLQLGKIVNQLADKLGKGFSRDKLGITTAVQYVLDANERQLAEDNLEHLVKRLLDGENVDSEDVSGKTIAPIHAETNQQNQPTSNAVYKTPQETPDSDSVENAIIEGIVRLQVNTSNRTGVNMQVWLGDELLEVASWRDIHAGLAEALLTLNNANSLETLAQIYDDTTEKRKGDGTTYPPSDYRQLSNGRFIFLNSGTSSHRKRISEMLTHLDIQPKRLKVIHKGATFYLP